MSLTHEDVTRILAILDEADCEEVDIEVADFKLHLRKHGHSFDRGEESAVQSEVGVQSGALVQYGQPLILIRKETS